MKRACLLIAVPALLVAMGFAQTPTASSNTDSTSIKGCLGGADSNYTLVEDNTGRGNFKITTSSVDLKSHLGDDVTVIGQKATTGAADGSFAVISVNMISEHCAAAAAAPAGSISTPADTAIPPPAAAAVPAATIPAPTDATNAPAAASAVPAATVATPPEPAVTPAVAAAAPAATVPPAAETASAPTAPPRPVRLHQLSLSSRRTLLFLPLPQRSRHLPTLRAHRLHPRLPLTRLHPTLS